jgi:hypothetical protein
LPDAAALQGSRPTSGDVRSVILLAGQVGRNPFADNIGRSILDLPIEAGRSVLDLWLERLRAFVGAEGLSRLEVVVSVDANGHLPTVREHLEEGPGVGGHVVVEVVRDPSDYRGTAGVVRDLTKGYRDEDWILVGAANQVLREPLEDLFEALAARGESVSLSVSSGSDLAGLFLLRCARLRDVPDVGFVDLKEQAIPGGSRSHAPLAAVRRPAGSTLPVRTLPEYIRALRVLHGEGRDGSAREDPFAETWKPVFSIAEEGAQVASGATLLDSVVLSGARVEAGAAVARSVVCPGGVVRSRACITESVVTGTD